MVSESRTPAEGAEAAFRAGLSIAELVREKQLAYGDASGIQHEIWRALLRQYEQVGDPAALGTFYVMPVALMDHIPRLTRLFDRICRIVSNPVTDRMGEDPWRDLAGDAICGIVMPRTSPAATVAKPAHSMEGIGEDPIEEAGKIGFPSEERPHPSLTRIWNEDEQAVAESVAQRKERTREEDDRLREHLNRRALRKAEGDTPIPTPALMASEDDF